MTVSIEDARKYMEAARRALRSASASGETNQIRAAKAAFTRAHDQLLDAEAKRADTDQSA